MSMMVPQVDLANHSFQSNADWEADFAKATVTLAATKCIAKGEPVCIDYGSDLNNDQMMRVFGFVVPGNPNDRLEFLLGRSQSQIVDDSDNTLDFLLEQPQSQPADTDPDGYNGTSRNGQQHHYLLAYPFLHSVGLKIVAEQMDQKASGNIGQGIVSCYEDPNLSRKLSTVLSLPLYASDQHAMLAFDDGDCGQVPEPGMRLPCKWT